MIKFLKDFHDALEPKNEEKNMRKFLQSMHLSAGSKILDIGCGYGRNMELIRTNVCGVNVEGVDVNSHIVQSNRDRGFQCYTPEEFEKLESQYDCMIFSHVIEHFAPEELKKFLDFYLSRLKNYGYVIIMTPVLWEGFYWDFDHVKMYHPVGIRMVFGRRSAQVQYYAENELILKDLWFRKSPFMVHYKRGLYLEDRWGNLWLTVNIFYRILFHCSFGSIGKTTGWMGIYRENPIRRVLRKAEIAKYSPKSIGIWGIGITAEEVLRELNDLQGFEMDKIKGFFCGDKPELIGESFRGYEVLDYRKINVYQLSAIIITAYDYEDEIYEQIRELDKNNVKVIRFKEK